MKEAVTAVNGLPPNTYGLRKDHKPVVEGEEHKLRPMSSAKEAPNCRLGFMAADMINKVADFLEDRNGSNSCVSTEEMAACILKF